MINNPPNYMNNNDGPAYANFSGKKIDAQIAKNFNLVVQEYTGFSTQASSYQQDYRSLDGPNSSRPGLTHKDYYSFRPDEAPANSHVDLILQCNYAYRKVGVIRNIIDLMGDFASQGIRIVCKNKKEQAIYNKWFKAVGGIERSERFMNNLYKTGNVVVRRMTGKTTMRVKRMLAKSASDIDIPTDDIRQVEIPWKYVFLDPTCVTQIGGQLGNFVDEPVYALKLPMFLKKIISSPNKEEKALVEKLPDDIKKAAKSNSPYVLPKDKVDVYFYKKDDWQAWGTPMLESILTNIRTLQKLELADMAALDGAISNVRLWKMGSLQHDIAPTPALARRLAETLQSNVGGGTFDIIWGPDLELVESKSEVYKFLGEEKYKPTLNAIYSGLGIPPTITGTFGAAGTSNNFISLKTLIQRLDYGRQILISFWEYETEQVRKALGLKNKAVIEFDFTSLGDDASEKQLWVNLYDRGLASDEMMQYIFKTNPDMESYRINKEQKERESGKRQPKAGAFYDPQFDIAYKKIALQNGFINLEQAGVEVEETKEKTPMEMNNEMELKKMAMTPKTPPGTPKKKGTPGQGRPLNTKDKVKRKTKKLQTKTRASLEIWGSDSQSKIAEILNPYLLSLFNKANFRQLNENESLEAEKIRFGVLNNIEPFSIINEESVLTALALKVNNKLWDYYDSLIKDIKLQINRKLLVEEERKVQAFVYAQTHRLK